jgi:Ca-activated chloride channel family protein
MQNSNEPHAAIRLLLTPDRPALAAGHITTLRVLVRVQAPEAPEDVPPRRPLHLALVLDRSGSMSGHPLEESKRCARHMLDGLAPNDRAAIYAFDDEVVRVAPLTAAADKLALASALATVESSGSTNLHGGWRAGADELAANLAGDDVHRVILLSDGNANAGETDLETIAGQCKALAKGGVTTSTYGLGEDFNEALMLAMAGAGRGNAYYGQTAADLAEPFAAEFALLTSLCARGLMLKVQAPDDVGVTLRNDYERVDCERLAWHLPDLPFASEAWALFELTIAPRAAGEAPVALPVTMSVHAATADSAPLFLMGSLPALPVIERAEWEAMPADALVEQRALELDAADALVHVRAAIEADDWKKAQRLAAFAAKRFARHPWAAAIIATMQRLIAERDKRLAAKEASFSARRMQNRLASPTEPPSFCVAEEAALPVFLQRKSEQGKGRRNR